MALPNLLDIAKRSGNDQAVALLDETATAHPELIDIPARTIKGTNYKTLIRTGLPTVGFRNANEGVAVSKGTYEQRLVETYNLNPRWECDKAVADKSEDGPQAYIADEASAVMEASMQTLATQFYYGRDNGGDAKGHPGLIDAYDSTDMSVDAGGTTATTGSSVWAVVPGPRGVQWVWGENGSFNLDDPRIETLRDSNSLAFTGYVQEMLAYPGLQVRSARAVARLRDLTADSGKTLTDALLASLLSKFPTGWSPAAFYMSRRSLYQLQASRTATNATGAPAPIPTEAFNIPIKVTDAILNTEALS